jgi:hypothetical protein
MGRSRTINFFLVMLLIICGSALAQAGPLTFAPPLQLDKAVLNNSIKLASKYLLASQKEEGNFIYEYDFLTRQSPAGDNQVRQAGALWGLALINRENPSSQTLSALEKGLRFFKTHSRLVGDARYIFYPGENSGSLGTVALVSLALIDFIPAVRDEKIKEQYKNDLRQYLNFILLARQKNDQFHSAYDLKTGQPFGEPSPYFDGESLLALVRAARQSGFNQFKPVILKSAAAMYQAHIREALNKDADSPVTKGFYQWGSMSFFEIYQAKWTNYRQYGNYVVDLAYWMIDVHQILNKPRNTAYAYEGLSCAFAIARMENNEKAAQIIAHVIDEGMSRLLSWQKGSPFEVEFLKRVSEEKITGGVMNGEQDPVLRIDVTQHQLHAMILVRKQLYAALPVKSRTLTENEKKSLQKIEQAILLAANYLKSAVKENGSFVYEYFPQTDGESAQYNMLRHAGTIYAMAEIYEMTGDKTLLEKIEKAIIFLTANLRSTRIKDQEVLVGIDEGNIKLGANALAILALTKYMDVTNTRGHLEMVRKLARWILLTQSPQGRFLIHKQDFSTQKISNFESNYYPGEAIYALTFLYRIDKSDEWLDAAEKAANYLIYVRDGGKSLAQISHDHWLIYGLNELYRLRSNTMYYEHAHKIAEAIRFFQFREYSDGEENSALARSSSTATHVEGLCAAYRLSRDFGAKKEMDLIFNGILKGIGLQLKTQVSREMANQQKWPQRSIGGFMEDLSIPAIRIDCVQHNVSGLIGAQQILKTRY